MKNKLISLLVFAVLISCSPDKKEVEDQVPLQGTWQLLSGTIIEKTDTTVTDYTKNIRMIKIINDTHFSFLNHDLKKGVDSTKTFVAGGGRYTLAGDQYTEHLEYCSDRNWESHDFQFRVRIENDTLIQTGTEKIEELGMERLNIEKYIRVK
jgi:hypothetical protein